MKMEQGTDEWKKARAGNVTASEAVKILKGKKGDYLASRKNYMADKVLEILTGEIAELEFYNAAMERGTEKEPIARTLYEAKTKTWVDQDGFKLHPEIEGLGGSPDGLINKDGCVEFKNPNSATHLATLRGADIKQDYIVQMNVIMMVYNREWCDFVSCDDRFPENLQLFIRRFYRDPVLCAEIEIEVELFNAEVQAAVEDLKGLVL